MKEGELRSLVATMRELGVLQCNGVVLGAEPPRKEVLRRKLEVEPAGLSQELAEELRAMRLKEARDQIRLDLAATGRDYSDAECDELLGPERIAKITGD